MYSTSLWATVSGLTLLMTGNIFSAFGQEKATQGFLLSFSGSAVSTKSNNTIKTVENSLWHFYTGEMDLTYPTCIRISTVYHSSHRNVTKLLKFANYFLQVRAQVTHHVFKTQNHLAQVKFPRNGAPTGRRRGGAAVIRCRK